MKVIKLNPNVHYLGFCKSDMLYHFIGDHGSREAYDKVKLVHTGRDEVYYCAEGGEVTLNWKVISESQLKSIINKPGDADIVEKYQKMLDLIFA